VTTTLPEHAPFYAAIAADPDRDAPRLVFADWLDEHGEAERAEFIRLGCEYWRMPYCGHEPELLDAQRAAPTCARCRIGLTADNLVRTHNIEWTVNIPSGVLCKWRRGFIDSVSLTTRQLVGEPCEHCKGTGLVGAADGPYHVGCHVCDGKRTLPGLAADLGRACPTLRAVVLTDREPYEDGAHDFSWWESAPPRRDHPQSDLPNELYELLAVGESMFINYDTRALALSALATAAARFCREAGRGSAN